MQMNFLINYLVRLLEKLIFFCYFYYNTLVLTKMPYEETPPDAEWVDPKNDSLECIMLRLQLIQEFYLSYIPDHEKDKTFLMYSPSTERLFSFCSEMFTRSERLLKDSGWEWVEDDYT